MVRLISSNAAIHVDCTDWGRSAVCSKQSCARITCRTSANTSLPPQTSAARTPTLPRARRPARGRRGLASRSRGEGPPSGSLGLCCSSLLVVVSLRNWRRGQVGREADEQRLLRLSVSSFMELSESPTERIRGHDTQQEKRTQPGVYSAATMRRHPTRTSDRIEEDTERQTHRDKEVDTEKQLGPTPYVAVMHGLYDAVKVSSPLQSTRTTGLA